MAAVIHSLWEGQDSSLLILPASVPLADSAVPFVLKKFLEDQWDPVLEGDVDGPNSLPLRLDRDNPNLGRYSACRRAARTLYLGSAPTFRTPNKGLEDKQVRLGCAQPGESVATFGDALRRLTDQATHLYVDGRRYWFSPQPSVTRLAQDRAGQQDNDVVAEEIKRRLREETKDRTRRGDFARIHTAPASSGDVSDEPEVRLVILGPESPHNAKAAETPTPARQAAADVLARKGSGNRTYANALVFLAADRTRLSEPEQAVRQFLAWQSIAQESEGDQPALELDAFQKRQVKTKLEQADDTVKQRIPETFQWLLVPMQTASREAKEDGQLSVGPVEWQEIRLQGQDGLAVRASKKLRNDDLLILTFGPSLLRMEMDKIPLWRGNHVAVKQLAEDFAKYLYLPRLRDAGVLRQSIVKALNSTRWQLESFAYAEGFDSARNRYQGLKAGEAVNVAVDGPGLLVRGEVAEKQFQAEQTKSEERTPNAANASAGSTNQAAGGGTLTGTPGGKALVVGPPEVKPPELRRFFGSVKLNATRLGRDAGKIAEEVVQHLAGLVGADVEITLEIRAGLPEGVSDHVVRTVTENCRTLKFTQHGFEEK
jgi:predicted AAA+ superfamily ATPase